MKTISTALSKLSDRELLCEVKRLAHNERQATSELIASLAELDVRRLYLGEGHPSLFVYCTAVLRLSESAAYHRIQVARAAQRFPVILDQLAEGAITLTAVALLAPHLTNENHREILDAARHKSRREVEHLVARLNPRPDAPSIVRKLPSQKPPVSAGQPAMTEPRVVAAATPVTPAAAAAVARMKPRRALECLAIGRLRHRREQMHWCMRQRHAQRRESATSSLPRSRRSATRCR
jgi:hypothetical protein